MDNTKLVKLGLLFSLLACGYVAAVGTFMSLGARLFTGVNNMLVPIGMLLLFVVSAAVMGLLVLGKPAMLYLDGHKSEGIKLLLYTVGLMAIFTAIFFAVILIGATA